jgi:regulator of protease activity HflC (stomatin/prohibitin superfamily)
VLQKIVDQRTEPWGINVISVEVKDVLIRWAPEDAMSMQAQAGCNSPLRARPIPQSMAMILTATPQKQRCFTSG